MKAIDKKSAGFRMVDNNLIDDRKSWVEQSSGNGCFFRAKNCPLIDGLAFSIITIINAFFPFDCNTYSDKTEENLLGLINSKCPGQLFAWMLMNQ